MLWWSIGKKFKVKLMKSIVKKKEKKKRNECKMKDGEQNQSLISVLPNDHVGCYNKRQ